MAKKNTNTATRAYDRAPVVERAWMKRIGCDAPVTPRGLVTRIMTDAEAAQYGVPLSVVRSARSRKAAQTRKHRAADADRLAQAETIERVAETGERVTA